MDAVLGPESARGVGDALGVKGLRYVQDASAGLGHSEDALHHRSGCGVRFEGGALLGSVLHHELAVAVGHPAGNPEASGRRLPHPSPNLLGKILAVELIDALDDGLHQLAGGGVVGVLGDGDDADALAPEHGLEGDGVLPFAGEPRKFPHKNFAERGLLLRGLVQHPAELRAIGDPAALGLVHVLAGDDVAVLLGVVPQRPQLGCHGQVHVLPVAGHPGIQGRRYGVGIFFHCLVLLFVAYLSLGNSFDGTVGVFHGSPNNLDNLVQKSLRGRVHDGAD